MKVVYVAGPFRARNPNGTNDAWRTHGNITRAMAVALDVWRLGAAAICPHANAATFQDAAGLPDRVWLDGDLELLRRSDALITVDGWEASTGATAEVEAATALGIPVFHTLDALAIWLGH